MSDSRWDDMCNAPNCYASTARRGSGLCAQHEPASEKPDPNCRGCRDLDVCDGRCAPADVEGYRAGCEPNPSAGAEKDTNPKDAVGTSKAPMMSVIPQPVIAEVGVALLEGARKYGRHNYRRAGVRASVYVDAAGRHLAQFWEGEDLDPDSGLSHVTKAIAGLIVLRDSMLRGNWTDDRPPRCEPTWILESNAKAKSVVEKYLNAVPAHTEKP